VNATGAWTGLIAENVLRMPPPPLALRKLSQIVVPKLFDSDNVYVFQNSDKRLIFASPYERDFTLIGSVGQMFKGDPAIVSASVGEIAYLCHAANRYFRQQIGPVDVVRAVAGANAVMDHDGRRDGAMTFDAGKGRAPLLTLFGGDVTMSRKRAEIAVQELTPFYPMSRRWTAKTPLPGSDFAGLSFDHQVDRAQARWRFLSENQARRLVAAYGTRVEAVLGEAKSRDDLGARFGEDLTGAEVRYLMTMEWARFPDDVLWRRSKLGLAMAPADREALAAFMATLGGQSQRVARIARPMVCPPFHRKRLAILWWARREERLCPTYLLMAMIPDDRCKPR
jgi:glycerol-3-phosphate dehydrogenase